MAITKDKGDLAEAIIKAECLKRGYKVAIPVGENWRYDLIVLRNGKLERVQCKYTESDGDSVVFRTCSCNNWSVYKYSSEDIDWMAIYDKTTDRCYFMPANFLTGGRSLSFRINPSKNNQKQGIRFICELPKF